MQSITGSNSHLGVAAFPQMSKQRYYAETKCRRCCGTCQSLGICEPRRAIANLEAADYIALVPMFSLASEPSVLLSEIIVNFSTTRKETTKTEVLPLTRHGVWDSAVAASCKLAARDLSKNRICLAFACYGIRSPRRKLQLEPFTAASRLKWSSRRWYFASMGRNQGTIREVAGNISTSRSRNSNYIILFFRTIV